jgi:uncharacterized protein (DUF362 family)
VSLNKLIKSNLVVVDGIVATGMTTKRLGLVMASQDAVAIDAAASCVLGLNPKSVKHIALAHREGVGNMNFLPCGESPIQIKQLFPRRRLKNKIRRWLAQTYLEHF